MVAPVRRKLFGLSLVALALIIGLGSLFLAGSKKFGAETYEAAVVADDAGRVQEAKKLYAEACIEGSGDACRALGIGQ